MSNDRKAELAAMDKSDLMKLALEGVKSSSYRHTLIWHTPKCELVHILLRRKEASHV